MLLVEFELMDEFKFDTPVTKANTIIYFALNTGAEFTALSINLSVVHC